MRVVCGMVGKKGCVCKAMALLRRWQQAVSEAYTCGQAVSRGLALNRHYSK